MYFRDVHDFFWERLDMIKDGLGVKRKTREDMPEKEMSLVLSSSCSLFSNASTYRILDLYIYTCELKLHGRGGKKTKNQSVTTRGKTQWKQSVTTTTNCN